MIRHEVSLLKRGLGGGWRKISRLHNIVWKFLTINGARKQGLILILYAIIKVASFLMNIFVFIWVIAMQVKLCNVHVSLFTQNVIFKRLNRTRKTYFNRKITLHIPNGNNQQVLFIYSTCCTITFSNKNFYSWYEMIYKICIACHCRKIWR